MSNFKVYHTCTVCEYSQQRWNDMTDHFFCPEFCPKCGAPKNKFKVEIYRWNKVRRPNARWWYLWGKYNYVKEYAPNAS